MSSTAIAEIVRAWNASNRPEHWIREHGASQDALRSAEGRLGIRLPADYSAFLLLSNGWAATGDPLGVSGLRPIEDVGYFAAVEQDWLKAWEQAAAGGNSPSIALIRRAIVLSTPGERALLLDPSAVDPASGEPLCVFFDNDAPRVSGPPESFSDALREVCESQAPAAGSDAPRSMAGDPNAARAYRRALGGDLSAIRDIERMVLRNWFAFAVLKQYQLLTNRIGRVTNRVDMLWWSEVPPLPAHSLLAEPLLHEEILPLYAREVFDRKRLLVDTIASAPPLIAETLSRCLATLEAGSEVVANFDYAPEFALAIDEARTLISRDPRGAWRLIISALDVWQPRCDHHLAPLGLRIDTQLRQLLLQDVPRGKVPARAIEVLEHPRGRYANDAGRDPDSE